MKHSRSVVFFFVLSLLCTPLSFAASQNNMGGMTGLTSAKAVFDVRLGNAKSAALHLKLIHQTFKDLATAKKNSLFRVVFLGPSVKLISKNRQGFSSEDQQSLDEIAQTVAGMAKDGIGLEICLIAARIFKVDPASVLPEVGQIENGWYSVIGYQLQGYALVPVY